MASDGPRRLSPAIGTALGTVLGLVSGTLGIVYLVRPNLATSTENRAEITAVALEPGVALKEYLAHPTVVRVLRDRARESLKMNEANADTVGAVVHFDFVATGYNAKRVATRWTLFDAATQKRTGESEQLDPVPFRVRFQKKQADIASWETWVHSPVLAASTLFVRVELYDAGSGVRLTFKDSPTFSQP
jgi:hypothetical protein